MKNYKHLFFDLDRTIYDFDNNAIETFHDIYTIFDLKAKGVDNFDKFIEIYNQHNNKLWDLYRKEEITKEKLSYYRFELTLNDFGIYDIALAKSISAEYVKISPTKTKLFPHCHETLDKLQPHFNMHIITNGFEEVQFAKLKNTDLMKYFDKIITSERAGVKKPEAEIFEYSLNLTGAKAEESLMIGDDINVDIIGARNAGIDQVFVNYLNEKHNEEITFEINSFEKLGEILIN
ncbi:MAG: YjjG family noncanonical pyrimidine nucleotidase [Saprospiraceae bacterium]|nr:YjjG family noncanonical pyrimidine nucleotidase [Saprospiraceae bacterium]